MVSIANWVIRGVTGMVSGVYSLISSSVLPIFSYVRSLVGYDDGSVICVLGVPQTIHYQSGLSQVISSTGGLSIFASERGNASNWISTDGHWNIFDYVIVFFFLMFMIPLILSVWGIHMFGTGSIPLK